MHTSRTESPDPRATFTAARPRSFAAFLDRLPAWGLICATQICDFLIVLISALLAHLSLRGFSHISFAFILGTNVLAVACLASFLHAGLYDIRVLRSETRTFPVVLAHWSFFCVLSAGFGAVLHDGAPFHAGVRPWLCLALFYACGIAGFLIVRVVFARLTRSWIACGNHTHAVGIVGCNELARQLTEHLKRHSPDTKVMGMFNDRNGMWNVERLQKGQPGIDELLDGANRGDIDTVIVALPILATDRLKSIIRMLRQQPLDIYLLPGPIGFEPIGWSRLDRTPFPSIHLIKIADCPITEVSLFLKGILDRVIAFVTLIAISPILAFCATGIVLSDPGPVFFRQRRVGYKGQEFDILKFRTMYVTERPNIALTVRNDRRVFPFGRMLRKTSLDELPQLINVLKGDMSLVGPRPHMAQATAAGMLYFEAVNDYAARHRVRPGITGWAQVNGWRGPTETIEQIEARVAHDIYYIENWSLLFDISILARTVLVLFGRNAF